MEDEKLAAGAQMIDRGDDEDERKLPALDLSGNDCDDEEVEKAAAACDDCDDDEEER